MADSKEVSQRFLIGETVMVRFDDGRRYAGELAEIVDASGVDGETWSVRLRDQSIVEVADRCVLERVILVRYPCPCCGYLTILDIGGGPPGTYAICSVCSWEDDLLQSRAADARGGANRISMNETRADLARWQDAGMPNDSRRRPPRQDEIPRDIPNA